MAAKVLESRIKKYFCDFQDQDGKVCGAGPYDIAHVGIHKRAAHAVGYGHTIECPSCGEKPPKGLPGRLRWKWLAFHEASHRRGGFKTIPGGPLQILK